jgi:uncharacterized membrane protein YjgN (DUF898 family)
MNDVAQVTTAPATRPSPSRHAVEFTGVRSDFRRLITRGAMLELVTFGFYRFWLATDIRRHLWSHTVIDGDSLEYTGRARELLIGFLFALAILLPVYVAYFWLTIEAEHAQTWASVPLVAFFYLFAQFALYRARRYRVTRTVWRGVRFGMGGSGLAYVGWYSLWTLGMIVTLGLLLPWRQAALERYKMRHTSYGNLPGRFDGTGWELFKRVWWIWLLGLLPVVLIAVSAVAAVGARRGSSTGSAFFDTAAVVAVLPFVVMVVWVCLYAMYKATEWRWWISGARFGAVSFESDLGRSKLLGLYWKVIGWVVLLIFLLGAWVSGVIAVAASLDASSLDFAAKAAVSAQKIPVLIALGLGYLVLALAAGMVLRLYLTRDFWARLAASASVHNLAAVEATIGQGQMASAIGEGFADSIDIGGF